MNIKQILIPVLCFLLFLPLLSQSAEENSRLTLDQCITIALQTNPLILSSYQQYQASLARESQAKAIPQPSLDYDSDLQPKLFKFKDSGESYFGISQTIEFPGKRHLRGKIASKETGELLSDIDLLKIDIIFQVKEAFNNLLLAQEKVKYTKENLKLANDFLKKAQLKYETGDVAKVEHLRASVEASKAANEVRKALNEERLAKAYLNFLMARKKYSPLEIQGNLKRPTIDLNLEDLKQKAFQTRPEMRKIDISINKESLIKKQGYLSYLPDFDLGVSRHKIEGEGTFWDVTVSLPIPLFFWQPRKGEIAESIANTNSLKREKEHLQNSISLEVEEAYTNAVTAQNQIMLFEEKILAQAEEVYEMFLFSYQEGEIGGIELIDARRTLIESRISYADALYNYKVALAGLEKSIGQKLGGEQQ